MKSLLIIIGLGFEVLFNILALNLIKLIHKLTKPKNDMTFACGGELPRLDKIIIHDRGGERFIQRVKKDLSEQIETNGYIHYPNEVMFAIPKEKELTEDEEMNALIDYKMQEVTLNKAKDIIGVSQTLDICTCSSNWRKDIEYQENKCFKCGKPLE